MEFKSSRFGKVSVPDDSIVTLPEGVLGFPDITRYVVLEHDKEGSPFKWLQAVDSPSLAFVVIDPTEIMPQYPVMIDKETAEVTKSSEKKNFGAMAIVNIPREDPAKMTVNLRAPILVNIGNRIGRQVILENDTLPLNLQLIPETAESVAAEA